MKKFIFLIMLLMIFIQPFIYVKATGDEIKYISTSVGENETEMGINYHTNTSTSYVKYSTNADLSNSIQVEANSVFWSYSSDEENLGFDARYINRVNLTNLNLDTTYYFQVVTKNKVSDIYQFTTARGFSMTTFAFVTDTQASDAGYIKVNNLTKKLLENKPDIRFMLMTGDIVDRGGNEGFWNNFFNRVEVINRLPLATIPGNHEYYLTSSGSYISPEAYNQFFNNPQNGINERVNSSYYFKYNDILFIMIDTIKDELYEEQRAWFEKVITTNLSRYIIVGVHAGCFTGGNYTHDASRMTREWLKTFEKFSVDLVISGHEHMFGYTLPLFNGEESKDFGVTHLIGPSGAEKQYNVKEDYKKYFVDYQNIRTAGCVIEALGNKLSITLYDESGNEQQNFMLNAKRPDKVPTKDVDILIDTLRINHNQELHQAKLEWSADAYGYIRSIKVQEANGLNISKFISTPKVLSIDLGSCWENNHYHYVLEITLLNGEVIDKVLELNLKTEPVKPMPPKSNNCQTGSFVQIINYLALAFIFLFVYKRQQ